MTSADLKFIPQSKAFAVDGEKNPSIPDTSTTAMNLATGFPSVYSKPLADGGKLIQRKEMNTLFYQLMLFQNFLQNGGYITWNNDVMMGIGGYPNGAVLSLIDSTTGAETRVQSCVDNNYLQPTSESIGEKYKVNTSTVPHTYTKDASGDVIWRYVSSVGLGKPDYNNVILLQKYKSWSKNSSNTFKINSPCFLWVYSVTDSDHDNLLLASYSPSNLVLTSSKPYFNTTILLEKNAGDGMDCPDNNSLIPIYPTNETYVRYHSIDATNNHCALYLIPMIGYAYVAPTVIPNTSDTEDGWRENVGDNYSLLPELCKRILGG